MANSFSCGFRPGGTGTPQAPGGTRLDFAWLEAMPGKPASAHMVHGWSGGGGPEGTETFDGEFLAAHGCYFSWNPGGDASVFLGVGTTGYVYMKVVWGLEGTTNTVNKPTDWMALNIRPYLPPSGKGDKGDKGDPGVGIKGDPGTVDPVVVKSLTDAEFKTLVAQVAAALPK